MVVVCLCGRFRQVVPQPPCICLPVLSCSTSGAGPVRPSLMQFVALCGRPKLCRAFNSLRPAAALLLWATPVRPAADTNVELAALTAYFDTDGGSRK